VRLPDAVELHAPVRTRLYLKRHLGLPPPG
jgi:hypothetical protein